MNVNKLTKIFQNHVNHLADAMKSQGTEQHGSRASVPFTMFFGDNISVFRTAGEFRNFVSKVIPRLRAIGMVDIAAQVLDCQIDDETRFQCTVEWKIKLLDAGWRPATIGTYFMTNPSEDFQVSMVSYEAHTGQNAISWDLSRRIFDLAEPTITEVAVPPSIDVEEFRQQLQYALSEGTSELPERVYARPADGRMTLPFFMFYDQTAMVFETPEKLAKHRKGILERFDALGLNNLIRNISTVKIGKENNFLAYGELNHLTPDGQLQHIADVAYSGSKAGPDFTLELARLTNIKFGKLADWTDVKKFNIDSEQPSASKPESAPIPLKAYKTAKVDLSQITPKTSSNYPGSLNQEVKGRSSLRVGDAGGLTQFGANIITLEPNAKSSIRHWHEIQDEFVIVLTGTLMLSENRGETEMQPGDCAAFPANVPNGHCFINRSDKPASFLVIGTHTEWEVGHYPDNDLKVDVRDGQARYTRADGSPL